MLGSAVPGARPDRAALTARALTAYQVSPAAIVTTITPNAAHANPLKRVMT